VSHDYLSRKIRTADITYAGAPIDTSVGNYSLEERMTPEVRWRRWLRDIYRWASITGFWPKLPSDKGLETKIDSIPIAPRVRRTREPLPSSRCIKSDRRKPGPATDFSAVASDTTLAVKGQDERRHSAAPLTASQLISRGLRSTTQN